MANMVTVEEVKLEELHWKLKKSLEIGKHDYIKCLQILRILEKFHLPCTLDVNQHGLVDSVARVVKYGSTEVRKKAESVHRKLAAHKTGSDEKFVSVPRKSSRLKPARKGHIMVKPEDYLRSDRDGFTMKILPEKGRAIFTTQEFMRGEFLLNYQGELIDKAEGDRREQEEQTGFRYFAKYKSTPFCIDATKEPEIEGTSLGRLVNHGKGTQTNCKMQVVEIGGIPRLCLYATKLIAANTELLYDYGLPRNFKFPPPYYTPTGLGEDGHATTSRKLFLTLPKVELTPLSLPTSTASIGVVDEASSDDEDNHSYSDGIQVTITPGVGKGSAENNTYVTPTTSEFGGSEDGNTTASVEESSLRVLGKLANRAIEVEETDSGNDTAEIGDFVTVPTLTMRHLKRTSTFSEKECEIKRQKMVNTSVNDEAYKSKRFKPGVSKDSAEINEQVTPTSEFARSDDENTAASVEELPLYVLKRMANEGIEVEEMDSENDDRRQFQAAITPGVSKDSAEINEQVTTTTSEFAGSDVGNTAASVEESPLHVLERPENGSIEMEEMDSENDDRRQFQAGITPGVSKDSAEINEQVTPTTSEFARSDDGNTAALIEESPLHVLKRMANGGIEVEEMDSENDDRRQFQTAITPGVSKDSAEINEQVTPTTREFAGSDVGNTAALVESPVHVLQRLANGGIEVEEMDSENDERRQFQSAITPGVSKDSAEINEQVTSTTSEFGGSDDGNTAASVEESPLCVLERLANGGIEVEVMDSENDDWRQLQAAITPGVSKDSAEINEQLTLTTSEYGGSDDGNTVSVEDSPLPVCENLANGVNEVEEMDLHSRNDLSDSDDTYEDSDSDFICPSSEADDSEYSDAEVNFKHLTNVNSKVLTETKTSDQRKTITPNSKVSTETRTSDRGKTFTPNNNVSTEFRISDQGKTFTTNNKVSTETMTSDRVKTFTSNNKVSTETRTSDRGKTFTSNNKVSIETKTSDQGKTFTSNNKVSTETRTSNRGKTFTPNNKVSIETRTSDRGKTFTTNNKVSTETKTSDQGKTFTPNSKVSTETNTQVPASEISACKVSSTCNENSYKKPYRYCIFCKKLFSKLRNHQEKQHNDIERVKAALGLGKKERDSAFETLRKEGILEYNKQQTMKNPDNPMLQRERKRPEKCTDSILVMCSKCSAFIEKKYKYRHEQFHNSKSDAAITVTPIPVGVLSGNFEMSDTSSSSTEYCHEVLSRFRSDEIGSKCITDKYLLDIGKTMYYKVKSRQGKQVEVRRQVMTDIRRLASLHIHLQDSEAILGELPDKEGNVLDLFKRSNFKHLQHAIDQQTKSGADLKAGLKTALYYLLKSCSKILMGMYLIRDEDKKADSVKRFVTVLEMHQHMFFGDALYQQSKNRQEKLRRPQNQPVEEDIQAVRSYTLNRMAALECAVSDSHAYIELRDLVVCRLVLFNARRGGEPTRLFIKNWEEADSGAWLDKRHLQSLDAIDTSLAKVLKVGYQEGKGRHLVPTLFPEDTHRALRKLADKDIREACGIAASNSYLFPSANHSSEHVSGWHAVNSVCSKVSLVNKDLLTATKNRHRVSTAFAMMEVPQASREYVYRHLGHSEDTNLHVYQAPLAVKELTEVGRRLQELDTAGEKAAQPEEEDDEVSQPEVEVSQPEVEVSQPEVEVSQPEVECSQPEDEVFQPPEEFQKFQPAKTSGRTYTHWASNSRQLVVEEFEDYLTGTASKKLPAPSSPYALVTSHRDFAAAVSLFNVYNQFNGGENLLPRTRENYYQPRPKRSGDIFAKKSNISRQ